MNDPLPFSSTLSFPFIAISVQMPLVMNVSVKWNDERTEMFVLQHQKAASRLKNKHTASATIGDYAALPQRTLLIGCLNIDLDLQSYREKLSLRERLGQNNDGKLQGQNFTAK